VLAASNTDSQAIFGEVDVRINMPYESRAGEFGNEIARWILNIYKDPTYRISGFELASNASAYLMTQSLAREPGDKITLSETVTGISATGASGAEIGFFIQGVAMEITPPAVIHTSWVLAPASGQAAWVLNQAGASEMGISTNLGYA
jgi:hypothetical protein